MTAPFSAAENDIHALVSARRLSDAVALARATLQDAVAPAEALARVQILLSSISLLTGDPESLTGAEAVLALEGLSDDLYDEAAHLQLVAALADGDYARAQELSEAVLGGVGRSQGDALMIAALTGFGCVAWREGRVANARSFLRAAVQRAERGWLRPARYRASFMLALLFTTIGSFDEAANLLAAMEDEAEQVGDEVWAAGFPLTRARLDLALGRLDEAREGAVRARDIAAEMGARTLIPNCEWMLAAIALYRGELDEAAGHVEAYRGDMHLIPGGVHTSPYTFTEAEVAYARHDTARAAAVLAPVYDDLPAHRLLLVVAPTVASTLTRRALAVGERERAREVATEATLLATANPSIASLAGTAAHARGLLRRDATMLASAERRHLHSWDKGSAAEDLGVLLAETDGARFAAAFERAAAAYGDVGATRDAERIRARLRQTDTSRRWHRVGVESEETGWSSLTDMERRVADLVSQGLTNSEVGTQMFMSRHTVGVHLRHMFRKLAIKSRVELTRIVIEQGD